MSEKKKEPERAQPQYRKESTVESQAEYLRREYSLQQPCPGCGKKVSRFEAHGITAESWDPKTSLYETPNICPHCQRELRFLLPIFKGMAWHWG